jgi:hypothetical protein
MYLTTGRIKDYRLRKLKAQYYKCEVCGVDLKDSEPRKVNLDHSHISDKGNGCVRGVLCSRCNTWLSGIENPTRIGSIPPKDLPEMLLKAARYIKKYHNNPSNVVHPTERSKKGAK